MAAPFSEADKSAIRKALLDAGLEHFARHGIGRARVEDICRDAGISKGSFYAFFPSKEDLFIAIGDDRREMHMNALLDMLKDPSGDARARVGRLFDGLVEMIETNTLMQVMSDSGDMARLKRKLTPERLAADEEVGARFYAEIADRWNETGFGVHLEGPVFADMMTLIAALTLQKKTFPAEAYRSAKALLRDMFVMRLAGGDRE
ncbi:TetR/AcrR family transcriptional regulator [Pelagibacterium halotolerans]|uniref:TetR/AcrR family transcriptional regulator n=1 Tax=Pelagibacterium halotolerans TaxID=531813 RepID=UPI00384E7A43